MPLPVLPVVTCLELLLCTAVVALWGLGAGAALCEGARCSFCTTEATGCGPEGGQERATTTSRGRERVFPPKPDSVGVFPSVVDPVHIVELL